MLSEALPVLLESVSLVVENLFSRVCCLSYELLFFFFKDFIYLFLERGEGKDKERERNNNVWLPLVCSPLETWPTTQACALTRN